MLRQPMQQVLQEFHLRHVSRMQAIGSVMLKEAGPPYLQRLSNKVVKHVFDFWQALEEDGYMLQTILLGSSIQDFHDVRLQA